MDLRPLGATGLSVSTLGLGTVKLGRTRGLKYPSAELPTDAQALALLRRAVDLGINLIDTAPAYGTSESRLGQLMHAHGWLGGRDRWLLCTKCGEEFNNDTGESSYNFSPAHTRMSVERSLQRLNTNILDIVLIHSDGRDDWIINNSGALEELARLRTEGKLRALGISTKSREGGLLAVERLRQLSAGVVMVTYNPDSQTEAPVIDAAARNGIGVLIKKGLASGHAANAPASIQFVLRHPGVSSLIVGTTNPDHLEANALAAIQA